MLRPFRNIHSTIVLLSGNFIPGLQFSRYIYIGLNKQNLSPENPEIIVPCSHPGGVVKPPGINMGFATGQGIVS